MDTPFSLILSRPYQKIDLKDAKTDQQSANREWS